MKESKHYSFPILINCDALIFKPRSHPWLKSPIHDLAQSYCASRYECCKFLRFLLRAPKYSLPLQFNSITSSSSTTKIGLVLSCLGHRSISIVFTVQNGVMPLVNDPMINKSWVLLSYRCAVTNSHCFTDIYTVSFLLRAHSHKVVAFHRHTV